MTTLTGTDGPDVLDSNGKDGTTYDTVDGKAGDDTITATSSALGSQGNDTIKGTGQTQLLYWDSPSGIVVDFSAGTAQDGWGTTDHFTGCSGVMTTRFNDTVIGSAANEQVMFAGAGQDVLDMKGGIDTVTLQIASPDSAFSFSKQADGSWLLKYDAPNGQTNSSAVLKGVELVNICDAQWNTISQWELFGNTATLITDKLRNSPQLHPELGAPSQFWKMDAKLIYRTEIAEQHGSFYYPTPADTSGPGYFAVDLTHNVLAGEFDGKPGQDLLLNVVWFPHVVVHTPVKPVLLVHTADGLQVSKEFSDAISVGRHMVYRTAMADYNGDGRLDFLSANSDSARTSTGQPANLKEPILAVMSTSNSGWTETTTKMEGQRPGDVLPFYGSQHDFAVGDVNGDGRIDFLTGRQLFLNQGDGAFLIGTSLLGGAADLRNQHYAMSSAFADVNGDGYDDFMFWMADPQTEQGYLFLNNAGKGYQDASPIRIPDGAYGKGNTKFNFAIAGDLNHDGVKEIVLGQTRAEPYYLGRSVQLLSSNGNTLVDVTNARMAPDPRFDGWKASGASAGNGEGEIFLVDVNADGHTDIVDSGSRVLLNDGEGYFVDMPQSAIPRASGAMMSGWLTYANSSSTVERLVPVDLDGQFGIDWVSQVQQPMTSSTQNSPTVAYLYSITSVSRFGKAGNGNEGAELGVPGFDEAYYLRHHPDVQAAIAKGTYASAVAHFLAVGKSLAYATFAPNTVVWGSNKGDNLLMQSGRETYHGGAGNDIVDGGPSIDTVVLSGARADHTIAKTATGWTVSSVADGVDTLSNVERLQFSDGTYALDISGVAGQAYRIYQAAFNRAPDATGLGFWIKTMDGGYSLKAVAQGFVDSSEFKSIYGTDPTNAQIVSKMYDNVLHRAPDQGGYDFWLGVLDSKGATVAEVLAEFGESNENVAALVGVIGNGFIFTPYGG